MEIGGDVLSKLEIRRRCKTWPGGLYFFAKAVCGFNKLEANLHLPLCNYVQSHPWNKGHERSNRKTVVLPREHFKSTICSVAFPLWLLACHDRNLTIALISAKQRNTEKWLREIAGIVTQNKFFRWAFDEIKPGGKWDQEELVIQRDQAWAQASITAYSIGGGLASQHHHYIILDDPIDDEMAQSESEIAGAVDKYIHLEEILRGWETSGFLLVGTPWGREDVLEEAKKEARRGYRLYWRTGVLGEHEISPEVKDVEEFRPNVKEGEPILPSECGWDKLKHIKLQSESKYYFNYLTKPYEAGRNGFKLELIRDYHLLLDGKIECQCHPGHSHHLAQGSTVLISDPAYARGKENCKSAVLAGVKLPCECRFLLEEWSERVVPPDFLKELTRLTKNWRTWVRAVGLEAEALQVTLKYWLEERRDRKIFPPEVTIFALEPKNREKDGRIASQITSVNNGWWHKKADMELIEGRDNLLHQLYQWPYGRLRDLADTFGYFDDAWEKYPVMRKSDDLGDAVYDVNKRVEDADEAMFETEEF